MSVDLLLAYIWDSLAFGASLQCSNTDGIKAWHLRLGLPPPVNGPGDYRRLTNCLPRFQATTQKFEFPIHRAAVVCLLLLEIPAHPPCAGSPRPTRLTVLSAGPSCTVGSTA